MSLPRMLVVDLDGTTLTADRRVADVDLAAARRLLDAGVHVTIATGRLFTGTRWVAEALGVTGSVAVMNGSELVDVQSGVARHGRYVDLELRPTIRRILAEHRVSAFLFESRRIHYGHADRRLMPYLEIWTEELSAHPDVLEHAPWEDAHDVVAICASGAVQAITAVRQALEEAIGPALQSVVFSTHEGEAFLKVRAAGDDKGTALALLANERGTTVADTVTIGDWINDVPMLQVAGRSFAMAHAREDVAVHADEVLEASRDGGAIAEVARKVWNL